MQAASAASLQRGREVLTPDITGENYLDIAQQLFDVADLLKENPALVRALTSPSRDGEDKGKLADTVFATALPPVRAVEAALARSHWSRESDLVLVNQELGIDAALVGAKLLGNLHTVEAELFEVAEFLGDHREVRTAIADTLSATPGERVKLAENLFQHKINPATLILVKRVVSQVQHGRILGSLLRVSRRASKLLDTRMVVVETATPFTAAQTQRLQRILEKQYQSEVTLNMRVTPELIGGARVQIDSDVIEGSLAALLDQTRRALAGTQR